MAHINVPTREEVNTNNQAIFDQLKGALGMIPNLYATYAHSENALGDYLTLANRQTTLNKQEKEVINLVTSQVNGCQYCLAAHTALGKMVGFTEEQILEIRSAEISWDFKLAALAQYVQSAVQNRGQASPESVEAFLEAGYSKATLIDTIVLIGDKTISNYLHGTTQVPIDFPLAPSLEKAVA